VGSRIGSELPTRNCSILRPPHDSETWPSFSAIYKHPALGCHVIYYRDMVLDSRVHLAEVRTSFYAHEQGTGWELEGPKESLSEASSTTYFKRSIMVIMYYYIQAN
jgi:hypothetical protein